MSMSDYFKENIDNRNMFLQRAGWFSAKRNVIDDDGSARLFYRLEKDDKTAILMEAYPDNHQQSTPGHKTKDFERIGVFLKKSGLNVPEIYASDHYRGFILLEDFGDHSFKSIITKQPDEIEHMYSLAVNTLVKIRDIPVKLMPPMPAYFSNHVYEGKRRLVDWYFPWIYEKQAPTAIIKSYLKAWDDIEDSLMIPQMGFVHMDFHVENLLFIEGATGDNQCGIIDFQGATYGPLAYDLANILEDPRGEIDKSLRETMIERYCHDMTNEQADLFRSWYRVLATQFHCRVLGQFIKLGIVLEKYQYLEYLPRLCGYIRDAIDDPVLAPLKQWMDTNEVYLDPDNLPTSKSDLEKLKPLIRGDAF